MIGAVISCGGKRRLTPEAASEQSRGHMNTQCIRPLSGHEHNMLQHSHPLGQESHPEEPCDLYPHQIKLSYQKYWA